MKRSRLPPSLVGPCLTVTVHLLFLPESLQGHTGWKEAVPARVPLACQALGGNVEDAGEVLRLVWRVCLAFTWQREKRSRKKFFNDNVVGSNSHVALRDLH